MIHKPIIDKPRVAYCGPMAVMLLTGQPFSKVERKIQRLRKEWSQDHKFAYRAIRASWAEAEVVPALKRFGCKVEYVLAAHREQVLRRFVEDVAHIDATYLVQVTGHFMVAHKGQIADTRHQTPIPIQDYSRPTRRIKNVWRVTARRQPQTIDQLAASPNP